MQSGLKELKDMNKNFEARDARNMVPKFVRKWSSEEESEGNQHARSDEHLIPENESMKTE